MPEGKFKEKFGKEWKAMLAENKVFNAKDACTFLGMDSDELNKYWATAKKEGKWGRERKRTQRIGWFLVHRRRPGIRYAPHR